MKIIDGKNRSLKQSNRYVVLNTLRGVREVSIADIARSTELSKPTVKKVLDHYIELKMVRELGKGSSTEEGGKKPQLYKFDEDYSYVISSHLGPDFINSALLNFRGEVVESLYLELDQGVSFEKVLNYHVDHIYRFKQAMDISRINSVVIALPGIVDPVEGVLRYSPHYEGWGSDLNFRSEIEKRIGRDLPVYVDNVNRYEAFIEMMEGAAVGVKNFATIDALEEGVGSGVILDGKMNHGSQNIAGEIGHTMVNTHDGCRCICGGVGCFEAEVSWRNIRRLVEEAEEENPESVLKNGTELTPDLLFTAVEAEDSLALEIMDKITTYFARGINNLIMVSDPELIIIQGIYNGAGERFLQSVKEKVDNISLLSLKRDSRICFSDYGLDRGVRGAGLYSISQFFKQDEIYQ